MTDVVKPIKAFAVHDGDEQWDIIFARSGAEARRRAANQWDCTFEEVESCRRAKSLDQFAECAIPVSAILTMGWWVECLGCGTRISEDDENTSHVVGTWDHAYCSPICAYNDLETKLMQRTLEESAVAELTKRVHERFSDIIICHGRAYVDNDGFISETSVSFTFPGTRYQASAEVIGRSIWKREDPPVRHLGDPPRPIVWRIAIGDLQAWSDYQWHAPERPFMLAA